MGVIRYSVLWTSFDAFCFTKLVEELTSAAYQALYLFSSRLWSKNGNEAVVNIGRCHKRIYNSPENLAKSGYSSKTLQDSVAILCINLQDRPEIPKRPLWNFSEEGTEVRKRQNLATKKAREKDHHKIVVLSGAGRKIDARVHNETKPITRSNGVQLECSKTQVGANDTNLGPNQRSKNRAERIASSLTGNNKVHYHSHIYSVVFSLSNSWSLSLLQKKRKWATQNQHTNKTKNQQ